MFLVQAQELANLGDKTNQMEGQATVVSDLKAAVELLKQENAGTLHFTSLMSYILLSVINSL